MDMKRLRDFFLTLIGLWLVLSPGIFHFPASHTEAVWNTWVVGAALILLTSVSAYLLDSRTPWEDLACAVFGFWLMISPWALGFSREGLERSNSLIAGAFIAVLALWALVIDANLGKKVYERMHDQHPSR